MKQFLFGILVLCTTYCPAQKYVLVDKNMSLPVIYANSLSLQNDLKGYFMVEKNKVKEFMAAVENIAKLLGDPKKKIPEKIDTSIGSTAFRGLKLQLSEEERIDIVLTTDYGTAKSTMHLCDAK